MIHKSSPLSLVLLTACSRQIASLSDGGKPSKGSYGVAPEQQGVRKIGAVKKVAKIKKGFVAVFIAMMFAFASTSKAQTLEQQVAKGTSPNDWLNDLRKRNSGKWKMVDEVSGPMAQILIVATEAVSEQSKNGTECNKAAATVAYSAVFDAYGGAGLAGFMKAIKEAIENILALGELVGGTKSLKDLLKDKTKEEVEAFIKKQLAKGKPEVYFASTNKNNCPISLISIWDRAAGTYEVIIYGDCLCASKKTGDLREIKLRTFAVRVQGTVRVGINYNDYSPMLNVDLPTKVSVNSNCDTCKVTSPVQTPPVETPPAPNPMTPKPPAPRDPCDVPPPCAACKVHYEKIIAACDRVKEIDEELIQRIEPQLRALKGEIKGAAGEKLQRLAKQIAEFNADREKLLGEKARLQADIGINTRNMKDCEKNQCGASKLDPCLVGTWRSEPAPLASQINNVADNLRGGNLLFIVKRDGSATFDYDQTATVANLFGAVGETVTIRGQANARITTVSGMILVEAQSTSTARSIVQTPRGVSEKPFEAFMPLGQGGLYECAPKSLILKFGADSINFKKVR